MALTDKIYLSAGLSHKQRDGFEYNETTGNDVNDLNLTTGRVALRFVPTDTLDIILRADVSHQDPKGNPRINSCDTSFQEDRKRVVWGKRVFVCVDLGGWRICKKKEE